MAISSMFESSHGGHSALVEMQLFVNGDCLSVAQMGPDFILVDEPFDHPPTDDASLLLRVDDSERRWPVRLPDGISASSKRIAIAKAP